jgi:transcription elongation factor GreB
MSKAFTREDTADDDGADLDEHGGLPPLPPGARNYMTPAGLRALREEYTRLLTDERPKVVEVVRWAASNGDRSENGDYIYGKKRLREIDRRLRHLVKRLEIAEVVDPSAQTQRDRVFFGATVHYADQAGREHRVTIVGIDEADALAGRISWVAPLARALLKARVGDSVSLPTPGGREQLEVLAIEYPDAA